VIVVDASVAIDVLLQTNGSASLTERLLSAGETLHAPHLLDVEVAHVLRRYWRAGDLTPQRAQHALEDLAQFPLMRYAHDPLLERMWQLRANTTAYDAAYIALAEALGATLLTRDAALTRVPGVRAVVELA
jgi:predicted nucleic acid-binding protein